MLNTFVLVGVIQEKAVRQGRDCTFRILCDRSFREDTGLSKQDEFTVKVWRGMADEISDIVDAGMLAAVKGRMRMEDGRIVLIAEQVSFDHRRSVK